MDAPASSESWVLVVDDDVEARAPLAEYLRLSTHATVLEADDGKSALDILRDATTAPVAVIADLEMPVMSGWDFVQAVHRDPRFAGVFVVVVSGRTLSAEERKSLPAEYLRKPCDIVALGRRIAPLVAPVE